jgi:hypothetical protein
MTSHDWVAIGISLFSAVFIPAVIAVAVAKLKILEGKFQEAIRDMEDRVVEYIRQHKEDSFAHPNLEVIRIITAKLDAIEASISALALMIERHIAREEK